MFQWIQNDSEGCTTRELLQILVASMSLFLMLVRLDFTIMIVENFIFPNVPNGKISLQLEMQNQGSFAP